MSLSTIERPETPKRPARRQWYAAAAGAAAILVAFALVATNRDGSDPAATPPLALVAAPHDAMAMCIEFNAATLAQMPVAFEGTVDAVDGETVTIDIDHWYRGGEATKAVITAPGGLEALIGGFDLRPGVQYLITATDGVINYCGFSGPSTAEMRSVFDEAFTG